MRLLPVSLVIFFRTPTSGKLEVWVQHRTDEGPFHGLLEFPGGGIEAGELPLTAAVREVEEEVGITINPSQSKFMGTYSNQAKDRTILLYVFLFPDQEGLKNKGQWLTIDQERLSRPYEKQIPPMNHQMIDDLYRSLYDVAT